MPLLKSLSRKSNTGQLVNYVLRYSLKENPSKHKEDATFILKHNIRSRSVHGYIKEFKENESFRLYKRKDSVTLFHNILSFAPEDKHLITDIILKDIVKKFIELRGNNNMYLAVAHKEKNHIHTHIIQSGVMLNGYSARVSKQKFKSIKLELDRYQHEKYPELIHSLITHEKVNHKSKKEIVERVQQIRRSDKKELLQSLEKNYTEATSKADFLNRLTTQQLQPYFRNNKLQGITINGRKFRLTRLGYDEEKLEKLNHNISFEEKNLRELQNLRTGNAKEMKQEMPNVQDESEQILVDELENIRSIKEEQELERSINLDENNPTVEDRESLEEEPEIDDDKETLVRLDSFRKPVKSITQYEKESF
jgi:hypothetical protein